MILASCSPRAGAVRVSAAAPAGSAAAACTRLASDLPQSLRKGLPRRRTAPVSPFTAAWGSPPVVIRCGVPIDPQYRTGDQVFQVGADGRTVDWYAVTEQDPIRWSTPLATVHVEVLIPTKYQGGDILALLTPAVARVRAL